MQQKDEQQVPQDVSEKSPTQEDMLKFFDKYYNA